MFILFLSLAMYAMPASQRDNAIPDRQMLGMAVDYFAGGKYHEALMLFIKLDKKYRLNPRFIAYMGVCYYHEQDYAMACRYLDRALPSVGVYSPAERRVYYNAAAESHFKTGKFAEAIPIYEKLTLICRNEDKADILYRLGHCYMQQEKWALAAEAFTSAAAYYEAFPQDGKQARMKQIGNMIKGCLQKAAN